MRQEFNSIPQNVVPVADEKLSVAWNVYKTSGILSSVQLREAKLTTCTLTLGIQRVYLAVLRTDGHVDFIAAQGDDHRDSPQDGCLRTRRQCYIIPKGNGHL